MNNRLLTTFLILFFRLVYKCNISWSIFAGISMLIASSVKIYFFTNIKLIENAYLDFLSIISGAIVITLIYHLFKKLNDV